jgi:hypothetical protein
MLTAKEIVDAIVSGADDDHDEDEIWDYGAEVSVDLGGVLGIQTFDLRRVYFNHKAQVIELRSYEEAAPHDPDPVPYGSTDADPGA